MANNSTRRRVIDSEKATIFLSELLGTALFTFIGCSSCLSWREDGAVDTLQIILSFGIAVLISVQIFGCISGAHINPAVTIAATIYNLITAQMACIYIVAQLMGAFMGYGLLMILTPAHILAASGESVCVTKPHASVTAYQAFGIEFLATATLVWFCCSIWDPRNAKTQDSVPVRFGLAVTGIASATCHYTGGSFNPARSFGPVAWTGDTASHYIYWIAPLSGAIAASVIYKHVFRREVIETGSIHCLEKTNEITTERSGPQSIA